MLILLKNAIYKNIFIFLRYIINDKGVP